MNWTDSSVLVTGAGGFIGSQLVERLITDGARVRAYVRYNSRSNPGLLKYLPADMFGRLEIIDGDLRDADAVRSAVSNSDTVFHLGALVGIPYSYLHPREVIETNILGTLNVLMAGLAHKVRRIVITSSSEVYGSAQYVPMDEKHPLRGQSPYSASKIAADKLGESFHRSFDLPVVTLRPFNAYGPRQSARAIIPTIITQALGSSSVSLGDLKPLRDFTYVTDVVDGFIRAAEAPAAVGQEINLGVGKSIAIGDLAQLIFRLVGKSPNLIEEQQRQRPVGSEVSELRSDNRKARALLEWEPHVALEDGLRRTIAWVAGNLDLYQADRYNV